MKSKSSIITEGVSKTNLLPLATPGEILDEEFLRPLGLSANALAIELRVPANRIHGIVNGQRSITADTALRLAQYFGNSAEFWMNLQQNYELDRAKREKLSEIRSLILRRPAGQEKPVRAQGKRKSGD